MKRFYIFSLLFTVILGVLFSPLASSFPDGLEKAGEKLGFIKKAEVELPIKSPLPDYHIPDIKNEKISTSLAGLIGTLLTFLIVWGISILIKGKNKIKVEKKSI